MLTAIELFNDKKATNVSTVQLASCLKISPGNLYYYFHNKEHLIRDIWLEMLAPKVSDLFYEEDLLDSEEGILRFFLQLSQYTYEFRFFYLELPTLLQNDPEMKQIYIDRAVKLMKKMAAIISGWSEIGIMNSITTVAKSLLIQNCWTLSQTGITYISLLDNISSPKEICDHLVQRLYALLHPYFSQKSHEKNLSLFEKNGLSFTQYEKNF